MIFEIESLNDELDLHVVDSEVKPDEEGEIVLDVTITDKDGQRLGFMGADDGHATITMSPNSWENKHFGWGSIDELHIDMDGTPLRSNRTMWNLVWMHLHYIWEHTVYKRNRHLSNSKCPDCDSEEMTGAAFETDHNSAWQNMSCDDCGSSWTDQYALCGQAKGGE